jgi:hypothetical protein
MAPSFRPFKPLENSLSDKRKLKHLSSLELKGKTPCNHLICAKCLAPHPASHFSPQSLSTPSQYRSCLGHNGRVFITPRTTISFGSINKLKRRPFTRKVLCKNQAGDVVKHAAEWHLDHDGNLKLETFIDLGYFTAFAELNHTIGLFGSYPLCAHVTMRELGRKLSFWHRSSCLFEAFDAPSTKPSAQCPLIPDPYILPCPCSFRTGNQRPHKPFKCLQETCRLKISFLSYLSKDDSEDPRVAMRIKRHFGDLQMIGPDSQAWRNQGLVEDYQYLLCAYWRKAGHYISLTQRMTEIEGKVKEKRRKGRSVGKEVKELEWLQEGKEIVEGEVEALREQEEVMRRMKVVAENNSAARSSESLGRPPEDGRNWSGIDERFCGDEVLPKQTQAQAQPETSLPHLCSNHVVATEDGPAPSLTNPDIPPPTDPIPHIPTPRCSPRSSSTTPPSYSDADGCEVDPPSPPTSIPSDAPESEPVHPARHERCQKPKSGHKSGKLRRFCSHLGSKLRRAGKGESEEVERREPSARFQIDRLEMLEREPPAIDQLPSATRASGSARPRTGIVLGGF